MLIRKYLSRIYMSLLLLLVMLPFQNCIQMEVFDAASVTENTSVIDENPTDEPSSPGDSETPQPPPPSTPSLRAAFVAVGHQGSSMYSCDDGQSWKDYRQLIDTRCDDPNLDGNCDHQDYSGKNVRWTPSGFILHYGHGGRGPVQRSTNGVDWETLIESKQSAGLAYGNGTTVLLTGSRPFFSDDDGDLWVATEERQVFIGNVRSANFVPHGGPNGVFIVQIHGGAGSGISVSYDKGRSYQPADVRPETCSTGYIAYNDSRILLSSEDLCYSDDAGRTWSIIDSEVSREKLFYTDGEFTLYKEQSVLRSFDGITWSEESMTFDGGSVPRNALDYISYHEESKKYVSIGRDTRGAWYENTVYAYSNDGVNWTSINDNALKPAAVHPVRQISPGYLNCAE